MVNKLNMRSAAVERNRDLDIYLRQTRRYAVMSKEEEKALAEKIVASRVGLWRAILSYPSLSSAIAQRVQALHSEAVIKEDDEKSGDRVILPNLVEQVSLSSRAYRDRQTKFNADSFFSAIASLAANIAQVDVDGEYEEAIISAIENAACENKVVSAFRFPSPPKQSQKFTKYRHSIDCAVVELDRHKTEFANRNLRLVIAVAQRFYGCLPFPDLVQEGNIGLLKAIDRFDISKGFRFSTYASWWIRHNINRAVANKGRLIRLPAHVCADLHKIQKARRSAEENDLSIEELHACTGIPLVRLRKLLRISSIDYISLDTMTNPEDEDDKRSLYDSEISSQATDDGSDELDDKQKIRVVLHRALERLTPVERGIIERRFGLSTDGEDGQDEEGVLTLRELGEHYCLSRERIRQLQERALEKLRQEFRSEGLALEHFF